MSGNQGVGLRVDGGDTEFDLGAIPSAPVAVAETIYVGRASFRVAHEVEATPGPSTDTTPWFRPQGSNYEKTAIVAVRAPWRVTASSEGVPIPPGAAGARQPARPWYVSSRWTIALPLTFGAFFCGLLLSPLATSSFSGRRKSPAPTSSSAPALAPTPAPRQAVPVVAPVVAPITPIEPSHPRQFNLVAAASADRGPAAVGAKVASVQGRVMKKNVLRNPSGSRRSRRLAAASSSSSPDPAPAPKHAWVDPWADN